MKLDLNKFYNSNYTDFVHKEAVEEALRMVAEIDLKEVEIDSILSITFGVDEFGENPIYVEYLDKEGKKHIVRIKPAVTNEIQEIMKRYVTLEQHETDKVDIYNYIERKNVKMGIRSTTGLDEDGKQHIILNNDNSYLSFQVDPETNNEIQWMAIENMGGLGPQSMYLAKFMDYAKVDQVPSNEEFLEKIQQLEELIQRKSQETLQSSKAYAGSQDDTLRAEITSNVINQINETKNGILSYDDVEIDNLKEYVANSCKTYTDTKTAETLETSKTYTDSKHTEVTQHVAELVQELATKVDGIESTTSQPLELSVSYNGNNLELNDYSAYTTIGDTTIVNINCNFTAPFNSGTTPILNTLTISSEKLKSFPTFMMDCIVKTATNVSSYTTTTVFSNKVSNLYVETPVIKPDETIATSLISFNGSYIFNNTKEAENNE